jgi:general secretion pathway protein F
MPTFHYRAYGLHGELSEGRIEAATPDTASDILWAQGLTPFQLRAANGSGQKWWQRELLSGAGAQRADLAAFTREFATLNAAEIPLDDALRILCEQASSPRVRALVASLLAEVLNGTTLSDAMAKQPKLFPADYVSVVRAGEIGGTVSEVFSELADLLERRMEIRARIQSALIYPCLLVALSLVTLAIIIGGLIPSIAPIFADSGKPMPATISALLAVQAHWPEIVIAFAAIATAAAATSAMAVRRPKIRLALDRGKLRVPVVGTFLLQQETARFARTLGTMLKAGVSLVQAATSARNVIANRHVAAGMDRAIEAIHQGVALHRALRNETTLPAIALQMISVGEEAGKLDRMLMRVAVMLEAQTQRNIERFMAMLTPILTVTIAVAVGALIMPVMNAVLSINDLAAR